MAALDVVFDIHGSLSALLNLYVLILIAHVKAANTEHTIILFAFQVRSLSFRVPKVPFSVHNIFVRCRAFASDQSGAGRLAHSFDRLLFH